VRVYESATGEVLWRMWAALSPRARASTAPPLAPRLHARLSYTPSSLAEKILSPKSALEDERKQVTVLFADLKGSMELLADRDSEEARHLLDPALERMMAAVHRPPCDLFPPLDSRSVDQALVLPLAQLWSPLERIPARASAGQVRPHPVRPSPVPATDPAPRRPSSRVRPKAESSPR
jgi:hypothetical protein